MKVQSLFELPHNQASRLVRTGAPVYVCVNPVEYHGPHLSLHNDHLVSYGLMQDLHRRLLDHKPDWPLLYGGELEMGVDAVSGPGSRPVAFTEVRRALLAACHRLVELGAQRLVIMTFHGSPHHNSAIHDCATAMVARGIPVFAPAALLLRYFVFPDKEHFAPAFAPISDPEVRESMMNNFCQDLHAGFLETSLSLHYVPDTVGDYESVPPCPHFEPRTRMLKLARVARLTGNKELVAELEFSAKMMGWLRLENFPGYSGRPHLANLQTGAFLADVLSEEACHIGLEVLHGDRPQPAPVLDWLRRLTLNGRIQHR
jgi:creatinine amidohydrolase